MNSAAEPRTAPLPAGLSLLRRLSLPRKLGLLERIYGRALSARGIDRIRLWKLDVERAEPRALAGATRLLRERRIDAVLVEISPETRETAGAALAVHSYRAMHVTRSGGLAPGTGAAGGTGNAVFVARADCADQATPSGKR